MENKETVEKEKQSKEDWKMIKEHKPFYIHGNNVSYSEDFVKRGKSKILINNIIYIALLIILITATICFAVLGFQDKSNRPLVICFIVCIPIDIILIVCAILNFIFNHVYTKQEGNIFVALYCNWWWKVLEVNKIQRDYGPYSKVMEQEVEGHIITIKGKNIDIKTKN